MKLIVVGPVLEIYYQYLEQAYRGQTLKNRKSTNQSQYIRETPYDLASMDRNISFQTVNLQCKLGIDLEEQNPLL